MARLHRGDRAAIAAYLKAVPPHPNGYPATCRCAAELTERLPVRKSL